MSSVTRGGRLNISKIGPPQILTMREAAHSRIGSPRSDRRRPAGFRLLRAPLIRLRAEMDEQQRGVRRCPREGLAEGEESVHFTS